MRDSDETRSDLTTADSAGVGPESTSDGGSQGPAPDTLEDLESRPRSRRGLITGVVAGVLVLAVGGAYLGSVFYTQDRIAPEASVGAVDVGGMTREDAVAAVEAGYAERTGEPIPIEVGTVEATLDPARSGLALDADASVDPLVGRTWNPVELWQRLFGEQSTQPVSTVDVDQLTQALADAESIVRVDPVDATIALTGTEAIVTDAEPGSGLDLENAVGTVQREWLTAQDTISLPVVELEPAIGQSQVEAAMADLVDPLLSGPVTIVAGEDSAQLSVETLSAASRIVVQDGAFALEMDGEAVAEAISQALPEVGDAAADARIELQGGSPTVVPSREGTGLDADQALAAVEGAALNPTEREAVLELSTTEAEFTTADAEALGVTEVIAEFSTPLPSYPDPERTENLRVGSAAVTGTLVLPGEEFSLLDALGPINASSGYNQSGVVINGMEARAYGGGLSQLSTTLFNVGFEAGLEDVEHKPHSRWFERYPAGREATLYEGSIDMRWRNTTDHGVLVQAWVGDDDRQWARLWGTETYQTTITSGQHYDFTDPTTLYNPAPECIPESGGAQGFTIDVNRVVRTLEGELVSDDTYSWKYAPWNRVVCGENPDA
ncbi:VanW family protein [Serinibacter salmoneus]|uniref:Vancomycin resistance protein YoaR n=1 Tax=Serinibacter salmoneus TaxID=556530 RepID=A0A2A9D3H0_9MICO|nr:VanW family protein [Serinibacter salmoneus]PFG20390.1 vancomycin resistance protein YoaR [Serinibacter salmoneus]